MKIFLMFLLINCYFSGAGQGKKPKKPCDIVFEKKENSYDSTAGESAWKRFVERNFNFEPIISHLPDSVSEFTDSLYVQFVISKDSLIEEPETTSPKSVYFKEEVLRLLKKSPKWNTAFQGGHTVKAYKSYLFVLILVADTGNMIIAPAKFPACFVK